MNEAGSVVERTADTARESLGGKAGRARERVPVLPPLYALLELVIFFGIVAILEWGVPSIGDIQEIKPHPFWLVVLLLSLQYGTLSGLLAAFCAILMSYLIGWPQADINENHFSYLVRIWTQPVLWIAAALLIGQFRMRQLTQRAELRRGLSELAEQRELIAGHAEGLRKRCDELERQLATQPDTTSETALAAFGRLGEAPVGSFKEPLAEAAQHVLFGAQCSLFVLDAEGLRLQASTGGGNAFAAAGRRGSFRAGDPLYAAIVAERRSLSVLDERDEASLEGQGLLAVPVPLVSSGAIAGMLKVEFIDPAHLDERILRRLELVAAQIGLAVERQGVAGGATLTPIAARLRARFADPAAEAAADTRAPINLVR